MRKNVTLAIPEELLRIARASGGRRGRRARKREDLHDREALRGRQGLPRQGRPRRSVGAGGRDSAVARGASPRSGT